MVGTLCKSILKDEPNIKYQNSKLKPVEKLTAMLPQHITLLKAIDWPMFFVYSAPPFFLLPFCSARFAPLFSDFAFRLSRGFRDLHGSVVKLGKTIDRQLDSNLASFGAGQAKIQSERLVKAVVHSLLRQGRFDVSKLIQEERNLPPLPVEKHFKAMHNYIRELLNRNPQPGLEWTEQQAAKKISNAQLRPALRGLRFELLKLRYFQLLGEGEKGYLVAIRFAREQFAEFAQERQREVERLAGSLLFHSDLDHSPYKDLCGPKAWHQAATQFESVFCLANGLSKSNPFATALLSSNVALPERVKYEAVIKARKNILEEKAAAPLEVNLGREFQFHSTFVCPILKDQATKANPPVLLQCGHAISQEAVLKISRSRRDKKIKCPTCPVETASSKVRILNF
jgi:E3 ubiquitin-protein transferase RMND5